MQYARGIGPNTGANIIGNQGKFNNNNVQVPGGSNERKRITVYTPQKDNSNNNLKMEGGLNSSIIGPDKTNTIRTLSDFYSGNSSYVTLAGAPSEYGKVYSFIDPKTGKTVIGVVHDTGGAFQGRPDKIDIPIDRNLTDAEAIRRNPFPNYMDLNLLGKIDDPNVRAILNGNRNLEPTPAPPVPSPLPQSQPQPVTPPKPALVNPSMTTTQARNLEPTIASLQRFAFFVGSLA